MISEHDKEKIMELAQKYHVKRILVFGSSTDPTKEARDIDLAVEGIADSAFFKFYGELIFALNKPVDLVDLKPRSRFKDIILSEGIALYG